MGRVKQQDILSQWSAVRVYIIHIVSFCYPFWSSPSAAVLPSSGVPLRMHVCNSQQVSALVTYETNVSWRLLVTLIITTVPARLLGVNQVCCDTSSTR